MTDLDELFNNLFDALMHEAFSGELCFTSLPNNELVSME